MCGTGYTGEEAWSCSSPPKTPRLWDELARRGARPRASPRATPCAWRPASTSTATSSRRSAARSKPASAGAASEDTGFIGAETPCARRRGAAGRRPERLVAFTLDGPGIAPPDNPVAGGGDVTSGTLSPWLDMGIGLAYVPAERAAVGTPLEIDVRGKMRARVHPKPLRPPRARNLPVIYTEEDPRWPRRATRGPAVPPRARLGPRRRGATRHARHHLVRAGRAGRGRLLRAARRGDGGHPGEPYAEVESVKAVSDVVAPLSGRDRRGQRGAGREPERINDDPYGEGWMVKVRLTDPAEREELLDADTYVASLG